MRRVLIAGAAASLLFALVPSPPASSTPVATDEATYAALGRAFPDPQGCQAGPGSSPFAKGNVCATDFMQFTEMVDGLTFLEELYPDFVELYRLDEDFDCNGEPVDDPQQACAEFQSAGLPVTVADGEPVSRDKLPLYMVRITDETVANKNKKYFVFPLSIHGIERAGVEGGTRAAEDLATWGQCEKTPDLAVCSHPDQQPLPHPLLEATPEDSITAGEALRKSAVYFLYSNPDGWNRGDRTTGTQFYQRYNGNGVDLNRDWPEQGYTFRPYTPWSEPETKSFGKVLPAIGPKDKHGDPKWTGGIDLHGQLIDRAFSFTLLGGTERPYDKNERILQIVKGAWADAEERLAWSPLIKPNDAPESDPRVYGVQWGTIWDTIDYTVTGALGNWIDSPMGLNADGIDNEMSLSHLSNCGIGSCWSSDVEQLHVDGNKSLIYSMINYALLPEETTFETRGKVAYLFNKGKIKAKADPLAPPPEFTELPPQEDIEDVLLTPVNDYTYEFDVKGPDDGVYNGGIGVTLTCANVQGVGPCAVDEALLERQKSAEEPVQGEEWEVVNSYFNQSPAYVQAGQALHANLPTPGRYRVRLGGLFGFEAVGGVFEADIDFTTEKGWEDPGQVGYKATTMRFWKMLKKFSEPRLSKITTNKIENKRKWRNRYDTIVVTDKVYPKLADDLREWVENRNGNLVLLDKALGMMEEMGVVEKDSVESRKYYAGYVNFATQADDETYEDPLARKIDLPGAAEGMSGDEVHRRQTYEPVPLGIAIQNPAGLDADNSPVWSVDNAAFEDAKGRQRAVGTTGSLNAVSYGVTKLQGGRVRFLGALLPNPTEEFDHPFGLADYALTYSGYQLLQNLVKWDAPASREPYEGTPNQPND